MPPLSASHPDPVPPGDLQAPLLEALQRHALYLSLDQRGRILDVNPAFAELAGWTPRELRGAPYRRLTGAALPPEVRAPLRSALAAEGSWRGVLPLTSRSGLRRWVDLVLTRLPAGFAAFGGDVTREHGQSEELARLGRLYEALGRVGLLLGRATSRKALFDGVCEALVTLGGFKMVWIGLDDPATHEVSMAAQHGDAAGYLRHIRVRSDDTPEGRGPGGLALRTGHPAVMNDFLHEAGAEPWREAARRAGLASNATFPLFRQGVAIGYLSLYSGDPGYFGPAEVGLMEKVANQLSFALGHLEEQVERARAEARFTTIFNASPAATSLSRAADGVFVEVNAAFHRILGYGAEEVLGHTGEQLGIWVEPDQRARYLENLRRKPGAQGWETSLRTKAGREIRVLYTGEILDMHGEMYVLSIFLDVTQAHQLEAERDRLRAELFQSQKMEALGMLAGGVAHDLNNVLGAILAHAEIMARKLPPESPLQPHLQQTELAVARSQDIVHQLLAFSRKLPSHPRPVDLNDQVSQFLRTFTPLLGEQVQLDWEGQPGLPQLTLDPHLLDQVVMNLLVNARDAMPKGGRITLRTRALSPEESRAVPGLKDPSRTHLCLSCRDTGLGMAPAVQARIFEPFFTTKGPDRGSGLGLSTVFGIVEAAGGAIEVESAPGAGSTFRILLPAGAPASAEGGKPEGGSASGRSLRILLVEDNEILRNALAEALRMRGHRVMGVGTSRQALDLLGKAGEGFEVVVTDMVLPDLSGPDLLAQAQARQPGLKGVLMSGYAPETLEERLQLGEAVRCLQKPFSSQTLISLLEGLVPPTASRA